MSNTERGQFLEWAERRIKRAVEVGFVEMYCPRPARVVRVRRSKAEWRERRHSAGVRF